MFLDYNRPIAIPVWKLYIRTAYSEIFIVAATWNGLRRYLKYLKFTGSTGKFFIIKLLKSRSVLGAKSSSAYNTSTGASKYIKI